MLTTAIHIFMVSSGPRHFISGKCFGFGLFWCFCLCKGDHFKSKMTSFFFVCFLNGIFISLILFMISLVSYA